MKTGSILCLCVIAVSARLAYAAQPGDVGTGVGGLGNGVSVRIVTKAEPPSKTTEALKLSNRYAVGNGVLHRFVIDAANHTYFGYDLYAEPLAGTLHCRVAILPLTSVLVDDSQHAVSRGSASASAGGGKPIQVDGSYRPVLLPGYPGPQVVSNGDTIALDLLISPDGLRKVVDYIDLSCKAPDGVPESLAARDVSLDDVEMHISDPSRSVNGTHVSGSGRGAVMSGSLMWVYFPGKGRFILSIVPRRSQGFVRGGTIRDNVISFRFGSDRYEVKSAATILGTGRTWNLYVLRDSSFEPKSGSTFGSATRLEQLFSNH
jgi:hypothetical protein